MTASATRDDAEKVESEIKVTDRRASSSTETQDDDSASDKTASEVAAPPTGGPAAASAAGLPPIDFVTFILSLSTSALVHLGEGQSPEDKDVTPDLGMAKQTIDLLAVLETKTKGNLTGEEERLLHHLLAELRMRYVAKATRD